MKINYSIGKVGIMTALLAVVTGCTTYVVQQPEPQTAYVSAPAPEPSPDPAPADVQPAPPPSAVVVIQSDDDFYQPLSPYGDWIVVGAYGRVWRPAHVEAGWRPYANGHWELTDDGWYWVSDEPWAWATYHYGRWQLAGGSGWIWVPETQWAPAWVSWREGGGYVGWAPLPPESRGGVSVNVTIAPAAYCFVDERRMHDPVRPTTVIVNNTIIINKTVNITKTKVVNKIVVNEGPRSDEVERVSGRKIQKVSLNELRQKDEEPVAEKHANLRAPAGNRGEQAAPQSPQPGKQNRPQNSGSQNLHPKPVMQPPARETVKPIRKPVSPQPVPARPPTTVQTQRTPVTPPNENTKNREQPVREQKPAPTPAPPQARPAEMPARQTPPAMNNPQRQPERKQPEVQPAPKPGNQREAKPPKLKKEQAPKNGREADGTNTSDQSGHK